MGSVYKRGDSSVWWIAYYDADGHRRLFSSKTTDKAEADKMLSTIERRVAAEREAGYNSERPLTVARYAEQWLKARRDRGVASVEEDEDRLAHALPVIGGLLLKDVRRVHLRSLMRGLMADRAKDLAPRTILHIYGVLRVMFGDALMDELIPATPCTLKQRLGELPKKRDKNPAWRHTAVFSHHEVEQLLSDERIPAQRRMLYGLLFLTGCRINELTPRRWRDYDRETKPLGKLVIASSYVPKRRQEKPGTKSDFVRLVPVHPTLAKMLATWRLRGWAEYIGREPKPDDLICPRAYVTGRRRADPDDLQPIHSNSTLRGLHRDLETLGLRERRQHDTRRTFVSLGIADGAPERILKWISHGPEQGEAFDLYKSIPWPTLCEAVAKLNIRLREGKVLRLPSRRAAT